MAEKKIATIQRYLGLSTDAKPSDMAVGSTFFEFNTGYTFIYNGYAWVPQSILPDATVNYNQISLNQAANTYDIMAATAQNLFIDAVIIHVEADLSAVATFTGISVQTDDGTPIEILSSTAGAKANLTGNFFHVYRGPTVTVSTKKIQLTIGGATAGADATADVTVLWRPLVAAGYYLNA